MRDMIYIVGITVSIVLAFNVGKAEGIKIGITAAPVPVVDVEKQCVAWFFNADLKAAKKHMCGGKK